MTCTLKKAGKAFYTISGESSCAADPLLDLFYKQLEIYWLFV